MPKQHVAPPVHLVTMLTFPWKSSCRGRPATGGSPRDRPRSSVAPSPPITPTTAPAGSQDGFLLIEVIISALLLGLVAVATFTGLQAVNANDANQRSHNEAVLLATQSQEELRSDPVTALELLVSQSHVYTKAIDGTTYTITQQAKQLNGSGTPSSCAVTEQSTNAAPNFRVTSLVTWNLLKTEHPVKETTIITPPTGSAVQVDVGNAPAPTAGVAGVTAVVTYSALETGTPVKLEGTTGTAGCVLFTGIRAISAKVEIDEKPNFVTPSGALKVQPTEVSIAPNLTTYDAVTYDEGGAIQANFMHEGKAVNGDTFVVANTEIAVSPELEVGSTAFVEPFESGSEERYAVKTSTYHSEALTAKGARYARGDLFPFPSSPWTVYAGDCAENNPLLVTKGVVKPGEGVVTVGGTTTVEVPMSYVNLEAYKGTEKNPSSTLATATYAVKITNLSCSEAFPAPSTPDNATGVVYVHTQNTTNGVLEAPAQPFGKFELCLIKTGLDRKDKIRYLNSTAEGQHFKFYPEEETAAETKLKREKEEEEPRKAREKEETSEATLKIQEETKAKTRETEETALKTAQTNEEAANKTKEGEEEKEREKWAKQVAGTSLPKISAAEKTSKEATQTTERNTRHTSEAAKAATRKTEETALHERKKEEEAAAANRVKAEKTTKETRTKEEAAKTKSEKEEETEAKEKKERVEKGVAAEVEAGTSC